MPILPDGDGERDKLDSVTHGFEPTLDLATLQQRPGAKWGRFPDRIAAWVADMDWPVAPIITQRLAEVLERGDLGYPCWPLETGMSPAVDVFVERMSSRYGWEISADRCAEWNDVIQVTRVIIDALTEPGDGIVLHMPSYPPFIASIDGSSARGAPDARQLIAVQGATDGASWTFDYDALETELEAGDGRAKMWILCHPHNPLGHVFGRAELERIAGIAERFDLIVFSDEIHADLVFPARRPAGEPAHVPFASLSPEVEARTVTVTSASKAFNLAGLRWAISHLGADAAHRAVADRPAHFHGAQNLFGVTAAITAWTEPAAEAWLDAAVTQIAANDALLSELLAEHLPNVRHTPNAATYLAWLDARDHLAALDGGSESAAHWYRSRGVELSNGVDFGAPGCARLNLATDPAIVTRIVEQLAGPPLHTLDPSE